MQSENNESVKASILGCQTTTEAALFAQLNGDPKTAMILVMGMSPADQSALYKACQSLMAFVPADNR